MSFSPVLASAGTLIYVVNDAATFNQGWVKQDGLDFNVSYDWDMGDWLPQETRMVQAPDKPVGFEKRSNVLKWIIS